MTCTRCLKSFNYDNGKCCFGCQKDIINKCMQTLDELKTMIDPMGLNKQIDFCICEQPYPDFEGKKCVNCQEELGDEAMEKLEEVKIK